MWFWEFFRGSKRLFILIQTLNPTVRSKLIIRASLLRWIYSLIMNCGAFSASKGRLEPNFSEFDFIEWLRANSSLPVLWTKGTWIQVAAPDLPMRLLLDKVLNSLFQSRNSVSGSHISNVLISWQIRIEIRKTGEWIYGDWAGEPKERLMKENLIRPSTSVWVPMIYFRNPCGAQQPSSGSSSAGLNQAYIDTVSDRS